METAVFILWVYGSGLWVPLVAFSDPDLCFAQAERNTDEATMCLKRGDHPKMYLIPPASTDMYVPRLEEQV